jgi:succinate-semialdehyde dehydrogenase/glutarate-semialdehyde dehydrogenase
MHPALLKQQCLVGGIWIDADEPVRRLEICNPADGSPLGSVPLAGKAETARAIAAASDALPAWRALTAKARSQILHRWHDAIVAHQEDLALILTAEQGKPLAEARREVGGTAAFVDWFAEEARRVYGETMPAPDADKRIIVIKEPIGVCAAITPWNFPSSMVTRKIAPALAAGCTVVLKPAEQTPFSALALAALALEAGVPPGVFNVVTGAPEPIGDELCRHPEVRKLSFTGSTAVGRRLMALCAPTVKKLSLELGGNAPFIVFDDADLDTAIDGAMATKFLNAGQTCVSPNRFLVQASVAEAFCAGLRERMKALRAGDGMDSATTLGPLIDRRAVTKVTKHVDDALAQGAQLLAGGPRDGDAGNYFDATLLSGATATMLLARQEIFGPVAAVFRFDEEADAIRMANDTEYGLAAYLYSRDIGRIWRVAEALDCGMVSVNTGAFVSESAPFGGVKQSGLGREASKYGIEEFLVVKYVCLAGISC